MILNLKQMDHGVPSQRTMVSTAPIATVRLYMFLLRQVSYT